jgi:hypothetical protein
MSILTRRVAKLDWTAAPAGARSLPHEYALEQLGVA